MTIVLDPDAIAYLEYRRESSSTQSLENINIDALRQEETALNKRYGSGPEMFHEEHVETNNGIPRYFLLDPTERSEATIIYFHGGGWVMSSPEDYLAVCRYLAKTSGFRVIVSDYRKAPENPFPAAYEDAYNLVSGFLMENPGKKVVIAGDSAGANLAAGVVHTLPPEMLETLIAQLLITPVLDINTETESYLDPQRQLTLTKDLMVWFLEKYLPQRPQGTDPRVSPLHANNFSAIPETIFVSVKPDVLYSEGETYKEKLREAGIGVREKEFTGQLHGFFQLYNVMKSSKTAVEWISSELKSIFSNH